MAKVVLKNVVKIYPVLDKKKLKQHKKDEPLGINENDKTITVVKNFNLTIEDKEFVVFVGPSGCGKSTTLRMVAGLEEISSGDIYIGDKLMNNIEPKDRDIAMVFQNYALYPHMTVYDNIAFPLKLKKFNKDEIDTKVKETAEILGISKYLDRKPKALSGGQRQRVAIGRAIVRHPSVLLMDEPLSNLDAKLRNQMRTEIIKLRKKINTTFIYVTHDQTEAMTLGDRIVIMKDGDIMQIGTPQEVFNKPHSIFVAGFIGTPQMNFFEGKLKIINNKYYAEIEGYLIELNEEKQKNLKSKNIKEMEVTFGIRPYDIKISTDGINGIVDVAELMGSSIHLHIKVENKDIVMIIPSEGDNATSLLGKQINFSFKGHAIHIFDRQTEINIEY